MLESEVTNKIEKQLDLRSFFKLYLDMRLLIKRTMTMGKRKLFALQRDRLPMLKDEDSFNSDLDVNQDIWNPKLIEGFTS